MSNLQHSAPESKIGSLASLASSRATSLTTEITAGTSERTDKAPSFVPANTFTAIDSVAEVSHDTDQDADDILLEQAEQLRAEIRDIIECRSNRGVSEVYQRRLLQLLLTRARNKSVWLLALQCFCGGQDIPLVECTKLGQHTMVEWLLTDLNLTKGEHRKLLDHPGQYGRNALQHGVRLRQWSCVNMLIRHGANFGYMGDKLGIVDSLIRSAAQQKLQHGSWRWVDKPLSDVFATCCFLYGEKWATDRSVDSSLRYGAPSARRGERFDEVMPERPPRPSAPEEPAIVSSHSQSSYSTTPVFHNRDGHRGGAASSSAAAAAAPMFFAPPAPRLCRETTVPYPSEGTDSSLRNSIQTLPFPGAGSDCCASARQSIQTIQTQPFPEPQSAAGSPMGSPSARRSWGPRSSLPPVNRGTIQRQRSSRCRLTQLSSRLSGSILGLDRCPTPGHSQSLGVLMRQMQTRRNTM